MSVGADGIGEQWLVVMLWENITKRVDFYLCRDHGQDILPVHMMHLM